MLYEKKRKFQADPPNFMRLSLFFFGMLALGNIREKEEKANRPY